MGCAACDLVAEGGTFGSGGCSTSPTSDGRGFITYCGGCCFGGRSPRGFATRDAIVSSASAGHLARMAQLEAASVDAFLALHADLARAGAPRRLLAAVRTAARDEVRHARDVGRAANLFGARVPRVKVEPIPPRSIERLAIENAEQGCIEETFGACVAAVQATRARHPGVRRLMRTIAREELRHAALSWDIAQWLESKLDAKARSRVARARRAAIEKLETELAGAAGRADEALGLPDATTLRAMLRRMRAPLLRGDLRA